MMEALNIKKSVKCVNALLQCVSSCTVFTRFCLLTCVKKCLLYIIVLFEMQEGVLLAGFEILGYYIIYVIKLYLVFTFPLFYLA